MSNSDKAEKVYEESVAELQTILGSFTATQAQKQIAQSALDALATSYGATIISEVNSRTALLNTLVGELNTVIASVQVNPIGGALDKFNNLVATAKTIIDSDSSGSAAG